jgi:phosphatidylglycerol:prolipoprotein diacylglycerol transferase
MNPIIFNIFGPFSISWYGSCVVAGLSVFIYCAYSDIRRSAIVSTSQFLDCASAGIIGGLLGGKILFLITQMDSITLSSWQDFAALAVGGFAILGAMIGALLGIVLVVRFYRIEALPFLDLVGAYALLAHGIARIGCLISGCCYGMVWPHASYAVVYTHPYSLAPLNMPLFPIQLVMSVLSLIGFIVCYRVYQIRGRRDGLVFGVYMLWETIARFCIDFFRGDRELWYGPLGMYQYVALGIIGGVLYYLVFVVSRPSARRRW